MKNNISVLSSFVFLFCYSVLSFGQVVKLTSSDGIAGDGFGIFVSLSGDYALIGANVATVAGKASGAAYVFKKENNEWTEQVKLIPDVPEDDDLFGEILALDGDYAVISAYNDDDIGENAGAAYVFKKEGEQQWLKEAKIYAADGAAFDVFGVAVDIFGDHILIGAYGDDDNGFFSGSAYVFFKTENGWEQEVKLLASDGATFDKFGRSVAISDEYAVVAGVLDDDDGEESGAVYVFKRTGNTWIEEIKITPDDGFTGDHFGRSVSIAGDYITVGAVKKDENGVDSGASYVFKKIEGQWVQQNKLVTDDLAAGDFVGYNVSSSAHLIAASAHLNDE